MREWIFAGAVFLIWSFGPWLLVFGRQTPLMLPGIAMRFVPILANARIPGSAMVVVYLAAAILAATGATWLATRSRRRYWLGWCLVLLVAIECAPAAPVDVPPPRAGALRAARQTGRPEPCASCHSAFATGLAKRGSSIRTCSSRRRSTNARSSAGFVARLSPDIARGYQTTPVLGSLLRLSAGGPIADEVRRWIRVRPPLT